MLHQTSTGKHLLLSMVPFILDQLVHFNFPSFLLIRFFRRYHLLHLEYSTIIIYSSKYVTSCLLYKPLLCSSLCFIINTFQLLWSHSVATAIKMFYLLFLSYISLMNYSIALPSFYLLQLQDSFSKLIWKGNDTLKNMKGILGKVAFKQTYSDI